MRLRYSAEARRQIEAIGAYIAQDNPAAAKRVVARIKEVGARPTERARPTG